MRGNQFVYNPIVNNVSGVDTGYTVPLGKYSIFTFTLSNSVANAFNYSGYDDNSESSNKVVKCRYILKSGDIVAYTVTTSNGYDNITNVTVNGTITCSLTTPVKTSPTSDKIVTTAFGTPNNSFSWYATEYNNV